MKNQTSKSLKKRHKQNSSKTEENKMKILNSEEKPLSAPSENALIRFLSQSFEELKAKPEVNSTMKWVQANPKISAGIGLGLFALSQSKRASSLAKFVFTAGVLGWIYSQVQSKDAQDEDFHRPLESENSSLQTQLH